jgi:hypothetical protein
MRWLAVAATLVALAAPSAATAAPTLRVVTASPLVVAGAGFAPGERVVVTAITLTGPRIARVRASAAGRFRARLRTVAVGCGAAVAVRALGESGRRAVLRRTPGSPCVPPPRD